jgi:hypothetical protein
MLREKIFLRANTLLLTAACLSLAWQIATVNGLTKCLCKGEVEPKYAYIDLKGNQIFLGPEGFDYGDFSDGILALREDNSSPSSPCSYFDKDGKMIGKGFERGARFSDGVARVGKADRVGFIDKSCKLVLKPISNDVESFHEGLAPVMVNQRHGFIDKTGAIVIDPFFEDVSDFSEGLAAARAQGRIGFINKRGAWQIKPRFRYVSGFADGVALVSIDDSEFYIDTSGQVVITLTKEQTARPNVGFEASSGELGARFEFIFKGFHSKERADNCTFHNGLAPMLLTNKFGYIDKKGAVAIPPNFEKAYTFSEGLARVVMNDRTGFIDPTGKFAVEPTFAAAGDFHEGVAAVAVGHNKWGYIDRTGKFVVPPTQIRVGDFHDGRACVQLLGSFADYLK